MLGTPIENATDNADVAFFTLCNPSNGITIFLIIVLFPEPVSPTIPVVVFAGTLKFIPEIVDFLPR